MATDNEKGHNEGSLGGDRGQMGGGPGGAHGPSGGGGGGGGKGSIKGPGPAPRPAPTTTPYGAPVHPDDSPYGQNDDGTQTRWAESPAKWSGTKQRVEDYNKAVREYEDRPFLDKVIDFVAGPVYDDNAPDINDPRTYWGGTTHTSTDPVATAAMIGGTLAGAPLVGQATSLAEDALGIDSRVFHNPAPKGTRESYGLSPEGGWGPAAGGTNTGADPGGRLSGDRTGTSGGMQGGLVHPSQIMSGGLQAQPENPPVIPPSTPRPNNYPTPTELWGLPGQNGSFVFDDATGQVKFLPA